MLTKNQILSFLESNKTFLLTSFNVNKIGIFGSFANNTQNEKSDLDLIVEFNEDTENLFEVKQKMNDVKFRKKEISFSFFISLGN